MRILPHQQDTGGFFVAVLHKTEPCPWENKKRYGATGEVTKDSADNGQGDGDQEKKKDEERDVAAEKRKRADDKREAMVNAKRPRYQGFKEDPFMYFDSKTVDPVFTEIKDYFEITEEVSQDMFLTRCKDVSKRNSLYFTSKLIRDLVERNEDRVKIINTGVKAFAKAENKGAICPYR